MPYYQRLGEIPRKHHIWFHRNGAAPTLQERRHRLRARLHDAKDSTRLTRSCITCVRPRACAMSS